MPIIGTPVTPAPTSALLRALKWSVLVAPVGRPITWAEFKAARRIDVDTEQTFGEMCIDAATADAEIALSCSLMPRTLLATFYDYERLVLPRGPLIEVLGITDRDDEAVTGFELKHVGNEAHVIVTGSSGGYPVSVQYRAGYANAAAIPPNIRLFIMAMAGTMFHMREADAERARTTNPHVDRFLRLNSRRAPVG